MTEETGRQRKKTVRARRLRVPLDAPRQDVAPVEPDATEVEARQVSPAPEVPAVVVSRIVITSSAPPPASKAAPEARVPQAAPPPRTERDVEEPIEDLEVVDEAAPSMAGQDAGAVTGDDPSTEISIEEDAGGESADADAAHALASSSSLAPPRRSEPPSATAAERPRSVPPARSAEPANVPSEPSSREAGAPGAPPPSQPPRPVSSPALRLASLPPPRARTGSGEMPVSSASGPDDALEHEDLVAAVPAPPASGAVPPATTPGAILPPPPPGAASPPVATRAVPPTPPPAAARARPAGPPVPPAEALGTQVRDAAGPYREPSEPKKRKAWWETFFNDDYLRTVRPPRPAQVMRQVSFLEYVLGLQPGATVLDVGCGLGLQAVGLSSRGHLVVGVDLSLPMLSRAADEAQEANQKINFLHADMREMSFDGTFDAVLSLGTSFGYFDDETNKNVLERMKKALKPGGVLLLDTVNRDFVLQQQPNLVWFEGDGCVCMEETQFNYITSRLHVKRTVILDDGRQRESEYAIRLYTLHEIGQLLHHMGFRVMEVSGSEATPGVFFGAFSAKQIILAERRADVPMSASGAHRVSPSQPDFPRTETTGVRTPPPTPPPKDED